MTTPTHSPSIMDETELRKPIVIGERCYDVQADVAAELARLREQNRRLTEAIEALIHNVAVPESDHPWAIERRKAHALARAALAEGGKE